MALICLIILQVLWLINSYQNEKENWRQSIQTAMQKTELRMFSQNGGRSGIVAYYRPDDSTNLNRNQPRVSFGYRNVDSVIQKVLSEMDMEAEYRITQNSDSAKQSGLTFSLEVPGVSGQPGPTQIHVDFDQRAGHIIQKMGWVVGGNILLLIIVSVALIVALTAVFRQKQVFQMRKEFINNLTHDFKTPVANVSLALEGLIQFDLRKNPEKADAFMDIAQKENRRLKLMIEKVLNLAAFENGKVEICKTRVDLHEIIAEIANVFEVQVKHRDGSLQLSLDATESIVMGDKDHLTQVVYNLLDNANKYSAEKPTIQVTTSNPDGPGLVEITVSDLGIGIPIESYEEIFEPYVRHDQTKGNQVKGFGLGLYYARQIIRMHKGDIQVSSDDETGSVFTIQLPLP